MGNLFLSRLWFEVSDPVNPFGIHRCGCDSIFVPMLEIRRAVICHPIIFAVADGSMVWSSTIAERNTLSSFDPNVSDVRAFDFSPPRMLTIYRWGWDCWIILIFYAFSTVAVPSVVITCCRPLVLPRSPIFGTCSPGVSTVKLDRPLHPGYAPFPGRLVLPFPRSVEHLIDACHG